MNPEQYKKVGALFDAVVELAPPQQAAYLAQACGADQKLRAAVEKMLADYAESQAKGFLEPVAWANKGSVESNMIGQELRGYILREEIKGGGMGEVYLAERHTPIYRRAVVKIPKAKFDEQERWRFLREMQSLDRLSHQNIARLYEYGSLTEDDRPFMIIEYIEGQSLRELLNSVGPHGALPLVHVIAIARQVSEGLSEAHRLKLIHRDLKPENIMLTRDGVVKLIDFGIAKSMEGDSLPTHRSTEGSIGTPGYMSPEQVEGNPLEPTSDIYSFGVVLFELLTGQRPFSGTSYVVARKQVEERPPSLRQIQPSLPEAVDRVVLKALAKDPQQRQSSIKQLADELQAASVDTQPDLPVVKVITPPHRRFLKTAIVAGGLLALPLGIGLALRQSLPTGWINLTPNIVATPVTTPVITVTASPTPLPSLRPSPLPSVVTASEGLAVSILLKGGAMPVAPDAPFRSGAEVRIVSTPPQDGVLYILQRGSSGKASILFPDPQINGGNYQVKGGREMIIPGQGGFKFDHHPGTETLYVLFARQRGEALLQELEAALDQKQNQLDGVAATTLIKRLETQAHTMEVKNDSATNRKTFTGQGTLVGVLKLRHE